MLLPYFLVPKEKSSPDLRSYHEVHFVNFQLLATEMATGKYSSTVLNDLIRGQRPPHEKNPNKNQVLELELLFQIQ